MDKIIQWNCRGLKANFIELTLLAQSLNPTAFCLQETHLKTSDKDKLTLKNYSLYSTFAKDDERAIGGSSIFIHNNIIHSPVALNTELQAVAVRVSLEETITLCSVYIPPNSHLNVQQLHHLVDQLPKPFILMGDFNAHNPLWGSNNINPKGKAVEDFMTQEELCYFNNGSNTYLHPGNGTYSAIDLTITDPSLLPDFSWRVHDDLCGSDHFPIILEQLSSTCLEKVPRWKFHKADWEAFEMHCESDIDPGILNVSDPVKAFTEAIINAAERTIPKTSTNPKTKSKPWYDGDCREAIRSRKKAERNFNKHPLTVNLDEVRKSRAEARRTLKSKRRSCWRTFVSGITSNTPMRKVWNMVQKLKGKNNKAKVQHLQDNNNTLTTPHAIANKLAETIAEKSSSNNYSTKFQHLKEQKEKINLNFSSKNEEDYNKPFSIEELKSSLAKANDSAAGPDSIYYKFLNHLPSTSLDALLDIFNHVFVTGDFPPSWREACVIPVPKPGKDRTDPSNYRPIALTSCLCKTMERMVNDRLVWYLEHHNLLTNIQCGFRQGRSTTDHLVRFETFIREGFVKNEHVVSVFFDLEKAYDTTWKYGILKDLSDMGLRGHLPLFISQFLSDRYFKVRVGSTFSDSFEQEMGVPQGSILSPTLFSVKINSLANTLTTGVKGSLYVDDFLICYRAKHMNNIERQLQLCLNKIEKWAAVNGFKFSTSKTVGMHFCNKRKLHLDPQLSFYGQPVKIVKETRFLGLIFDSKLSFIPHIKMLKAKCNKALDIIKVVSSTDWGADRSVLLNLYRSLVRSKLDYGSIIYGSARKTYLQMLDPIHHQGLRLSLGAFRTSPVESLYVESNEPSLKNRRIKLALQYATKLKAHPNNPAYDCVFHPEYSDLFEKFPNKIASFGIRIKPHVEESGINFEEIAETSIPSSPPWIFPQPKLIFDLRKYKKSETNHLLIQQDFAEIKETYPKHKFIYTDGSRDGDRVASAAIFEQRVASVRLSSNSSIFTAEARAILLALKFVSSGHAKKAVICSDSLSCLLAISNFKFKNPIILHILEKHRDLINRGREIVFCWIPSHIGIRGNTVADREAKAALGKPITHFRVPHTDLKPRILKYIHSTWQAEWDRQVHNKLHDIQSVIGLSSYTFGMSRKDQVVLARCRIGHSRLTHNFILDGGCAPECIPCNERFTIEHILVDCADFADIRRRFYTVDSISELFYSIAGDIVIKFLKAIALYGKI